MRRKIRIFPMVFLLACCGLQGCNHQNNAAKPIKITSATGPIQEIILPGTVTIQHIMTEPLEVSGLMEGRHFLISAFPQGKIWEAQFKKIRANPQEMVFTDKSHSTTTEDQDWIFYTSPSSGFAIFGKKRDVFIMGEGAWSKDEQDQLISCLTFRKSPATQPEAPK